MNKKIVLVVYLSSLFLQISCGFLDYERSESEKIIGNFYVVNLHLKEQPGFFLMYKEKNGHDRIFLAFNECIDYLKSSTSKIIVKTKPNPQVSYYLIEHINGDTILNCKKIFDSDFRDYELNMQLKKTFIAK